MDQRLDQSKTVELVVAIGVMHLEIVKLQLLFGHFRGVDMLHMFLQMLCLILDFLFVLYDSPVLLRMSLSLLMNLLLRLSLELLLRLTLELLLRLPLGLSLKLLLRRLCLELLLLGLPLELLWRRLPLELLLRLTLELWLPLELLLRLSLELLLLWWGRMTLELPLGATTIP